MILFRAYIAVMYAVHRARMTRDALLPVAQQALAVVAPLPAHAVNAVRRRFSR
jgi:hypothetical protein